MSSRLLFLPYRRFARMQDRVKSSPPAIQRVQPVVLPGNEPPGFVKGGLHGKLVMLKGQIGFGGSIVGKL